MSGGTPKVYFVPEMANDHYLLEDLRRSYIRAAANQGWFENTWLGVPIWQIGEDLVRLQQVISQIKPKWIVETGTKFGGSAIFFSSVFHCLGLTDSRIISIDICEHVEAQEAFSSHSLKGYIADYIIDDAISPKALQRVRNLVSADRGTTMVFLDDDHNRDHVLTELREYSSMVTPGSMIVVADTVFGDLSGSPVGKRTAKYENVAKSNPRAAVQAFLEENDDFQQDASFLGAGGACMFPDGFLRRVGKHQ